MDRKITTQQIKTSKVNTVSCILLNILANIYRRCGTQVRLSSLDCEALSFLLQWKLGVKENGLNRNESEK